MNEYLIIYEGEFSGCQFERKTIREIRAMLKNVGNGLLKIYRIRRGKEPELLRMRGSMKDRCLWLEDRYGNYIENV